MSERKRSTAEKVSTLIDIDKKLYDDIKKIVDEFDPLGLLCWNKDEYDIESYHIFEIIKLGGEKREIDKYWSEFIIGNKVDRDEEQLELFHEHCVEASEQLYSLIQKS